MDRTIDLFGQIRSADSTSAAAYDTLKQARALVARALASEQQRLTPAPAPVIPLARAA